MYFITNIYKNICVHFSTFAPQIKNISKMTNALINDVKQKATREYDFIKGEFSADEASGILNHLYSKKINFHEVKRFSDDIRFGIKDEGSEKRIKELKASLNEIEKKLDQARAEGKTLRLSSKITIELI